MTVEINGMAHVILTVTHFEEARAFYSQLLPQFGMKPVFDGDKLFYCVGAERRSASSLATGHTRPSASGSSEWAYTTSASAPVHART
jgi:catechol 2,3-dioxygenase-like lactoylglutathione lyase family enzyme